MPKYHSWFALLLIAISLLTFSLISRAEESPEPVVLNGGIDHSEALSAVPAQFQPGRTFQAPKTEVAVADSTGWRMIPPCMAGTWEGGDQSIDGGQDLRSGAPLVQRLLPGHRIRVRGHQVDARGDIWDYMPAGAHEHVQHANGTTYFLLTKNRVLSESNEGVVSKITDRQVEVGLDGRVKSVTQSEQIIHTVCLGAGHIRLNASIKTFDVNGKPMSIEKSHMDEHRVKGFQTIGTFHGGDLQISLARYLQKKGMLDRIQPNLRGQQSFSSKQTQAPKGKIEQYQPYQRNVED